MPIEKPGRLDVLGGNKRDRSDVGRMHKRWFDVLSLKQFRLSFCDSCKSKPSIGPIMVQASLLGPFTVLAAAGGI